MFYKAKITSVNEATVSIEPLLTDRDGKYLQVKDVSVLQLAGGQTAIDFKYEVGDVVLVALCGYPVKYDEVNQDSYDYNNFDNSVVVGKLYGKEGGEGVTIKHKDNEIGITANEKFRVQANGKSVYEWLDGLLDQLMANKTVTQLGAMTVDPVSMQAMQRIKNDLNILMEK